jgi:hypothetical protein
MHGEEAMDRGSLISWGGVAGIVGGLLGVLLSPVVTAAGNLKWGADLPWEGNAPAWLNPFRSLIEPLLALPPQGEVYSTYGKLFLAVYLLLFLAAVGLRSALEGRIGPGGQKGTRLILVGLGLNVLGNIADYWLGYSVLGQPWWGLLFLVGTTLGHLVYVVGSIMAGRAVLKSNALPAWWAWLLMVTAAAGFILPYWGVRHVPSGMVLPMSICWFLTGFLLLSTKQPGHAPAAA